MSVVSGMNGVSGRNGVSVRQMSRRSDVAEKGEVMSNTSKVRDVSGGSGVSGVSVRQKSKGDLAGRGENSEEAERKKRKRNRARKKKRGEKSRRSRQETREQSDQEPPTGWLSMIVWLISWFMPFAIPMAYKAVTSLQMLYHQSIAKLHFLQFVNNGHTFVGLVDGGSQLTLVSKDVLTLMKWRPMPSPAESFRGIAEGMGGRIERWVRLHVKLARWW
eukprot:GHVN01005510.1.p1 GENE.GHVN01005510.1~~GHVN01005510.1.p1  ORF type:complete len:218 (-),score=43.65 GHVN01005510.1:114-767(-)